VILDLEKFLTAERPCWEALEQSVRVLEAGGSLDLAAAQQFLAHYERASAALAKLSTFAAEPATRRHLESLVARAYAALHETRDRSNSLALGQWLTATFPQTFRRRWRAFRVSLATTFLGILFGALSLLLDPGSRSVTMAFGHDQRTPSERVAEEESAGGIRMAGQGGSFAAALMRNNIQVSIFALALGMTFGLGSLVALFYNGVILGAIACDYIQDGQGVFLAAWILPHGSIELPAILIAGQAGLVLGNALLNRHGYSTLADSLRSVVSDLVTLIAGVALMLVWAGIIEGTLSQYHAPVVPYWAKILFGLCELSALCAYLGFAGRTNDADNRRIPISST
jgi:uncharacterized membrane protein SpoIIM required for sporulation